MFKLGVQIYSVRNEYAADPLSCFKQMKAFGYDGAELFGSIKTHPAEQLKAWLAEAGLEICGYHTQVAEIREDIDAVIAYNRTLGNRFVIVPAPAGPMSTAAEWHAFSRELNGYKNTFAAAGFRFGFHSHRNEVLPVDDGSLPWDIVAADTDDDFILQIDMGNTLRRNCTRNTPRAASPYTISPIPSRPASTPSSAPMTSIGTGLSPLPNPCLPVSGPSSSMKRAFFLTLPSAPKRFAR